MLLPHPLCKKKVRRNARRGTHAPKPQPPVPIAQSIQAPQVPSLLNLRLNAPPFPIVKSRPPSLMSVRVNSPLPPSVTAAPPPVLEPASAQHHLAPLRNKFRVAVRILSANDNSQCSAVAYGGYSASAGSTTTSSGSAKPPALSSAFASTALIVSAAASSRVYCCSVAFRNTQVQ